VKSASFEYIRPQTVDEVLALLQDDTDATIIAGGQTLVPMMAMRLARPLRLVDIARIPELSGVRDAGDAVAIGATTRQADAERNPIVRRKLPLLAKALPWVGHTATRNRGTVGGSVANADPAAEISLVLVALAGQVAVRDSGGAQTIAAADFFVGPMMTAMQPGMCIAEVRFPVWPGRVGTGFQELSARRSDFALASAAVQVTLDAAGRCTACAIGIGGATPFPARLPAPAGALIGSALSDADIAAALAGALDDIEIMTDPHGSPEFRRRAATALAARALAEARDDARAQPAPAGAAP
jgi:CO/xanthine dehydrogenase FAD-binding subunit